MSGKPVSELADLPFGGDIIVDKVETLYSGIRLHVAEKSYLIEISSGNTWECPEELF